MDQSNPLISLDEAGTSVWLDYIRRKLVESGELQRMVDGDGLRGMTSNPTIFQKAISGSSDYDVQIRDLVEQGKEPLEIFQVIAADDIRNACDVLRPIYDRLNGYDGYVSIEVSPAAADDTQRTLDEAHDLWKLVDRPNVMIKVPGTDAGLPAIEQLISEGINVNITLLFSVDRYVEVTERFIAGLEKRLEAGESIESVNSVASFFVSRVDSAIDKQLQSMIDKSESEDERKKLQDLLGKAAIANAKIAYEHFQRIFSGRRWEGIASRGGKVQRPLWASTSTKNPAYRDVMYVEELIGPDTVNTMPQATMNAFKDHGQVRQSLTENVAEAQETWQRLQSAGIELQDVTDKLQVDGVRLFTESFDDLMSCIDSERTAITMGMERSESESLGSHEPAVEKQLKTLQEQDFVRRLWEKDGSLWSQDESEQQSIKGALGWLDIIESMKENIGDLEEFALEIKNEFDDVVVLGMGGSSLCPDVLAHTFPRPEGWPRLSILDTTYPDAIEDLRNRLDLGRTLFIVSSKSGTTAEPKAFYHFFWSSCEEAGISNVGAHFVVITDPGTPLESEARKRGVRRVFAGAPDIGGRYSALSNFGMVPAACTGIDVRRLLDRAETMMHATQPCVAPAENPGVRLGTIMGVLAQHGHDKLTLVVDSQIATLGGWLEQLIAESTGKSGTGILPVADEPLGDPDVYGDDRLFVCLRMRPSGDGDGENDRTDSERRIHALEAAGHPVVVLELQDRYDLGGEFFLWEIATATAGSILGINAFNQPNVQESKDNTNRLIQEYREQGSLKQPEVVLEEENISVSGPAAEAGGLSQYISEFLDQNVAPTSYVALMAYIEPSGGHTEIIDRQRRAIRERYKVATTFGYGPRFLHSTGQFHKGGPAEGVFMQIVGESSIDLQIAEENIDFKTLVAAQSIGDYEALRKHQRPVIRINLGRDVDRGLQMLLSAMQGAGVAT